MARGQSGLGAVPRPPSREITDVVYGQAAVLANLLRPLPLVEKPTAFLRWTDSVINGWAVEHRMPWTLILQPTSFVAQIGKDAGQPPIVGSASAGDHSEILEQARRAGYDTSAIQSLIVRLDVRNTFYPATMADLTVFLDELDAVLGHELVHVAQNVGARRTANTKKSDLFRIYNAPFDCTPIDELPVPTEPHVAPCYGYVKGKRRIIGYGIPIMEAGRWPDPDIAYAAMRQYLSGPEERTAYSYSIAAALVTAGLTTIPDFPGESEAHMNACTDLRMYDKFFSFADENEILVWNQIRRQALVYMRQLIDATKAADKAVSKSAQFRARREEILQRRRGVQRVMQSPSPAAAQSGAARGSMIELD